MKDTQGLEIIAKKIVDSIKDDLNKCGLMYRIFYRVKSYESIEAKINKKKYRDKSKKLTDIIGIRITLYFQDDVEIVYKILKEKTNFDHESTDQNSINTFEPIRCNLTFNLSEEYSREAKIIIDDYSDVIDTKYEVQIRTVLSEGWHEVEHDLRYKCPDEWEGHDDLNRNLNGIFATLETSEFAILQIFNNLAYRNYKENKIEPLLKTKYRIRLKEDKLDKELADFLIREENKDLIKKIFRADRKKFIFSLINSKVSLPITITYLVLLINHFQINDDRIREFESDFIKGEFEQN